MDEIFIHRIAAQGRHGVLASEKLQSQLFEVDVKMFGDFSDACKHDALEETVDYSVIGEMVKGIVVQESFDLIERLADEIAVRILDHQLIEEVEVVVRKMNPPVSFALENVGVRIRRSRG